MTRLPARISNPLLILSALAATVALGLSACSSVPVENTALNEARNNFRLAQANPQTQSLAAAELRVAGEALAKAEAALSRGEPLVQVNQLSYLARQYVSLAREVGSRKGAEAEVAAAGAETDQMRLAARTREADNATRAAASATQQAQGATRQAEASQRSAAQSQQQAQVALQQAGDANQRNAMLEQQLRDMNAKKTDRGMVVTIGDVLFDTGRAELRSGGIQNLQRLGTFLKTYPQRKAQIEGYTDSVGSDAMNLTLSTRRAAAVKQALVSQGVEPSQVVAQGFGEANPVATNDEAAGRQANRRVEVVLSDEQGAIAPR